MTKQGLIEYVAKNADMSKAEAGRALEAVLDGITYGAKKDKEVVLTGFGKFAVKVRPKREGINPATKEKITIPSKAVVSFKAGSKLKDAVNK